MTTRLDIALGALREIEADSRDSVGPGKWYGCGCYTPAEDALRAIAAAPREIVLTREDAVLCIHALFIYSATGTFRYGKYQKDTKLWRQQREDARTLAHHISAMLDETGEETE